jgi:histidyl-tRNA synthetase
MIKPKAISGFFENLPDSQIVEEKFKDIIKKNYSLSGFTIIDTPIVERLEILISK